MKWLMSKFDKMMGSISETDRGALYFLLSILLVWMVPSLLVWTQYDHPTAGQIGDTFGMVNSLFSALAVVFVVIGLRIQNESNKKNEELNRDSARLQALTSMAEFNADLMSKSNDPKEAERYRQHAELCAHRATQLMSKIGEELPTTAIGNQFREAAEDLRAINKTFIANWTKDDSNLKAINASFDYVSRMLKDVSHKYAFVEKHRLIQIIHQTTEIDVGVELTKESIGEQQWLATMTVIRSRKYITSGLLSVCADEFEGNEPSIFNNMNSATPKSYHEGTVDD